MFWLCNSAIWFGVHAQVLAEALSGVGTRGWMEADELADDGHVSDSSHLSHVIRDICSK